MTAVATPTTTALAGKRRRGPRPRRLALYGFLTAMSLVWLFPLAWGMYTALRPFSDTQANGYISTPEVINLDNFVNAWNGGDFALHYFSTLIVTIPAVIATLVIASMVAFAVSRFTWRFNILVLLIFTAGNLLPAQVIIVPLYKLYTALRGIPAPLSDNGLLYNQYFGLILINVVFQTGFSVFVLSNYMKTLSKELVEAAVVDGASVLRIWGAVIMPLCRPALAALATLEFTFIYNDFFWGLMLIKDGDRRPITSALNNLQGQFFTNTNLLAAGALLAAIPTILVFMALQRQFISGLSLGSTKG
ncbi:MAG: carbohydrate ABC transporter permease [Chloroflexi bacterium]|nr:carbohydrate ABC transporter permease [Chloroflexota bacterium]